MQIVHTVGNDSLLCDLIETETPPRLVYSDLRHVFRDTAQCEYFIVRQKIYDMLFQAKSFLPEGVYFKAFELYRPMKKQILRWEKILSEFQKRYPDTDPAQLEEKANVFIANPYKQGSGHQTGAAVDLTLCDSDGTELDMGTKYQEFNSLTQTFPDHDRLTDQQKENRKILCRSMQRAGFVNYFPEWWHYSYGEIEWAVITHTGKTLYLPLNI